ncbi:hypothetical protein ACJVQT_22890 [Enterobacter huaxiensis]|uniref:hypothetical protein n=1 Tax=Enterobacter huaxiensis TaxID=2494702 RepID=UPI002175ED99|nr:hypothetical protein [Enterobacter huaxiensis]MCS5452514.1 hypothetical protein [Enterobacter huaxiensis]
MIPETLTDFWHSPLGVVCLVLLLVSSVYNVISPNIDDGLFDRLFRWVIILTTAAALSSFSTGISPHHIGVTLITAFTARLTFSTIQRMRERSRCKKLPPDEC